MRILCFMLLLLAAAIVTLQLSGHTLADDYNDVPVPQPKPLKGSVEGNKAPSKPSHQVYQSACPVVLAGRAEAKSLPPLIEGDCGERSPLNVTAIAGVQLSSPATINCRMATALTSWIPEANRIAKNVFDSAITKIQISTSYQCRRRNNAPDGKISEHGFANALDIMGFELSSGQKVNVLGDWPLSIPVGQNDENDVGSEGPEPDLKAEFLRLVHASACKRFTTVLGPDADVHHADHFHFDLGCHGKRCTYLICQ